MKGFAASSTDVLEHVKEQVSSGLAKVKGTLRHIPVVGRLFRKNLKNLPLQIGRATHIIIVRDLVLSSSDLSSKKESFPD
ncbi:hypothetical protein M407DRAFT_29762 [Tulasnella calospora MUT 4182]|uniref:Uncharacterized protein n=1 Tax=Tulasnella calospora MUT 4182 TaxID=1051891 RepID=A0A0C3LGL0_9AGAM|nr:hypothetical protein M407DRAFT_29762 [Tulasnella calospora MUT 4182]